MRADPNDIREKTVRNAILMIRAKSSRNPRGAMTLLNGLRNRLLIFPGVLGLPDPWSRPPLNVRQVLEEATPAAYNILEEDVIDLARRAEEKKIAIAVADKWEKAALEL